MTLMPYTRVQTFTAGQSFVRKPLVHVNAVGDNTTLYSAVCPLAGGMLLLWSTETTDVTTNYHVQLLDRNGGEVWADTTDALFYTQRVFQADSGKVYRLVDTTVEQRDAAGTLLQYITDATGASLHVAGAEYARMGGDGHTVTVYPEDDIDFNDTPITTANLAAFSKSGGPHTALCGMGNRLYARGRLASNGHLGVAAYAWPLTSGDNAPLWTYDFGFMPDVLPSAFEVGPGGVLHVLYQRYTADTGYRMALLNGATGTLVTTTDHRARVDDDTTLLQWYNGTFYGTGVGFPPYGPTSFAVDAADGTVWATDIVQIPVDTHTPVDPDPGYDGYVDRQDALFGVMHTAYTQYNAVDRTWDIYHARTAEAPNIYENAVLVARGVGGPSLEIQDDRTLRVGGVVTGAHVVYVSYDAGANWQQGVSA